MVSRRIKGFIPDKTLSDHHWDHLIKERSFRLFKITKTAKIQISQLSFVIFLTELLIFKDKFFIS